MPRPRFLAAASLWFAATLPVLAQDKAAAPNSVSLEQAKEIREFVLKENRTSAAVPAMFKLGVGAILPPSVELHAFDGDMGAAWLRYTIIGGKIVVVDPDSRRVVHILE
jgi:Protein of unknown function (DUF1236)